MSESSLETRVAILETHRETDAEQREIRRRELDEKLEAMNKSIQGLSKDLTKYQGFIGGINLAITILWAGLVFAKDWIFGNPK